MRGIITSDQSSDLHSWRLDWVGLTWIHACELKEAVEGHHIIPLESMEHITLRFAFYFPMSLGLDAPKCYRHS